MIAIEENQKDVPQRKPRKISWETFQQKYLSREDKYKYEWLDGIVEKTPRAINKKQLFIQDNLLEFLYSIKSKYQIKGQLIAEGDNFFLKNHRRPDIAFYTRQQLLDLQKDKYTIPEFVIEVISPSDNINTVNKKIINYRNANVKIIWHLFPEEQEVHIYKDNALKMEVKRANDMCSAEPVIKGFTLSVADIFKE
ncbi:MAG: Uma2 family endonuclease [Saprospiraceae bacterium]